MRAGLLFGTVLWVCIVIWLTGCSVKAEFGWHGETAVNDKTYTASKK